MFEPTKRFYKPGDILIVNYSNMDGQETKGLFMVYYDEALDSKNFCNKNILCCKVTSKNHLDYGYYIPLASNEANVKYDSKIACTKLFTFDKSQIDGYLGTIKHSTLCNVCKMYNEFNCTVNSQLYDALYRKGGN